MQKDNPPSDTTAEAVERCSWCGTKIDPDQGSFNDDGGNPLCENCWEAADE